MKTILAIAALSLKAAIRSKLFAGSALFLFACMAGLPFLIKGDGTAVGEARVLMFYNISIASTLIGMLALIEACGAVSQEIAEKQIQLVRSKPVSAAHIWLGKWLGILCINAVLVTVAALTTRGAFAVLGLSGDEVAQEVLTSRRRIAPNVSPIEHEVEYRYQRLKEAGRIAEDANEKEAKEFIKLMVVGERTTIGPQGERRWTLGIPAGFSPNDDGPASAQLRSRFNAAMRDEKPMKCSWKILSADGDELFAVPSSPYYDGLNIVNVPLSVLEGRDSVIVVFHNDETAKGRTVVFNERRGLEILVSESFFAANMFRAMLVVFIFAALLAAIGLTLGAVLSFPVAVFAALAIVLASVTAHFFSTAEIVGHSHDDGSHCESSSIDVEWGEQMSRGFERIVGPVFRHQPAKLLSDGLLISWRELGGAVLLLFLLYPGILFAVGSLGLSRRQLALPESI